MDCLYMCLFQCLNFDRELNYEHIWLDELIQTLLDIYNRILFIWVSLQWRKHIIRIAFFLPSGSTLTPNTIYTHTCDILLSRQIKLNIIGSPSRPLFPSLSYFWAAFFPSSQTERSLHILINKNTTHFPFDGNTTRGFLFCFIKILNEFYFAARIE
jgi:hypothetical protein